MMDTLLPVIVGGIIGVLGGLVGPPLAHWLNENASKKKTRADKLEELIGTLYAYDHWLNLIRGIRAFGHDLAEPPSPFPTAQAIAVIYFPKLDQLLAELEMVAQSYEVWMLEAAKKRLKGEVEGLNVGFQQAYQPYRVKLVEVIAALKELAKTEFAG